MADTTVRLHSGTQVPFFQIHTASGEAVDSWQFKQQEHLVVVALGSAGDGRRPLLEKMGEQARELEWLDARVIVLVEGGQDTARKVADICHPACFVAWDDGVREKLEVPPGDSAVILVDRFGAIIGRWDAGAEDDLDLEDILATLRLVNWQCPECGVPEWLDLP